MIPIEVEILKDKPPDFSCAMPAFQVGPEFIRHLDYCSEKLICSFIHLSETAHNALA